MPAQKDLKRAELMQRCGYISSARTAKDGGWVVAYVAEQQDIPAEDGGKYAIICEQHGSILQVDTKAHAREIVRLGATEFCDCCRENCTPGMYGVACPSCGAQKPME